MIGIDKDFPMTRVQARILVIGLVVMAAVGIALFGGLIPGIRPNFSTLGTTTIGGHAYYVESTPLKIPFFAGKAPPWNVSFRNVTFELSLTNWYSATGGIIHGNGTEVNGTRYAFELGQIDPNGSRAQLYLSPDSVFGAEWAGGWLGGFTAQLLVATSYSGTA